MTGCYSQVVRYLYMSPAVTFKDSAFCAHIICMYFVCLSESRLIISLHSINKLLFEYDMDCVISGVKTEFLYIISMNFGLPKVKHYTVSFG
jgi:hypothetical protein